MRLDSNVAGGVIGQQSLEADAEKENRTHKVERPLAILKKKNVSQFYGNFGELQDCLEEWECHHCHYHHQSSQSSSFISNLFASQQLRTYYIV